MARRLVGKKAVIVGGTDGIGLASAKRYAQEGARVFITGTTRSDVDAALDEIGEDAVGVAGAQTGEAAATELARVAEDHLGGVDVLFVNGENGLLGQSDMAFSQVFERNLKGLATSVQGFLPLMSAGGSIILTGMSMPANGAAGQLYFASKSAIRTIARNMGEELAHLGIRVNTLSPGADPALLFDDPSEASAFDGAWDDLLTAPAQARRMERAEEIAAGAVFLASDESATMAAGDLIVDGGWLTA